MPTSSPSIRTLESSAMARLSARFTACTKFSSVTVCLTSSTRGLLLFDEIRRTTCVNVVEHGCRRWRRHAEIGGRGFLHGAAALLQQGFFLVPAPFAEPREVVAQSRHWL